MYLVPFNIKYLRWIFLTYIFILSYSIANAETLYCFYFDNQYLTIDYDISTADLEYDRDLGKYLVSKKIWKVVLNACEKKVLKKLEYRPAATPPKITIKKSWWGSYYEVVSKSTSSNFRVSKTAKTPYKNNSSNFSLKKILAVDLKDGFPYESRYKFSSKEAIEYVLDLRDQKNFSGREVSLKDLYAHAQESEGNRFRLLLDREYFNGRQNEGDGIINLITSAQSSINIYIMDIEDDRVGRSICNLLIKKKRELGDKIKIRVMLSRILSSLINPRAGHQHIQDMKAVGIEVILNKLGDGAMDHRKMVVVDGKEAIISGTCLSDLYYYPSSSSDNGEQLSDKPAWHDYGIQISGPLVIHLQASFLQSWMYQNGVIDPEDKREVVKARYFPTYLLASSSTGSLPSKGMKAYVVHSNPSSFNRQMQEEIFYFVDNTDETLDIEFSYIHVRGFVDRLIEAANSRGVKIRLIIPGEEGLKTAGSGQTSLWYYTRHSFPELFNNPNIKVYETKEYTHRKFMVADGRKVFFSTGQTEWTSWSGRDEIIIADDPLLAEEIFSRSFKQNFEGMGNRQSGIAYRVDNGNVDEYHDKMPGAIKADIYLVMAFVTNLIRKIGVGGDILF